MCPLYVAAPAAAVWSGEGSGSAAKDFDDWGLNAQPAAAAVCFGKGSGFAAKDTDNWGMIEQHAAAAVAAHSVEELGSAAAVVWSDEESSSAAKGPDGKGVIAHPAAVAAHTAEEELDTAAANMAAATESHGWGLEVAAAMPDEGVGLAVVGKKVAEDFDGWSVQAGAAAAAAAAAADDDDGRVGEGMNSAAVGIVAEGDFERSWVAQTAAAAAKVGDLVVAFAAVAEAKVGEGDCLMVALAAAAAAAAAAVGGTDALE